MGFKALVRYEKQPLERDDIQKIDVVAEMAKLSISQKWRESMAPITKAPDDFPRSLSAAERQDNQLVTNYTYKDADLTQLLRSALYGLAYEKSASKHPIWDLIKRGWL